MINAIAHYILNGTKLFVHQFISATKAAAGDEAETSMSSASRLWLFQFKFFLALQLNLLNKIKKGDKSIIKL